MESQSVSVILVLCCDHKCQAQAHHLQSSNCNKFDFYYWATFHSYKCEIKASALPSSKPQSDETIQRRMRQIISLSHHDQDFLCAKRRRHPISENMTLSHHQPLFVSRFVFIIMSFQAPDREIYTRVLQPTAMTPQRVKGWSFIYFILEICHRLLSNRKDPTGREGWMITQNFASAALFQKLNNHNTQAVWIIQSYVLWICIWEECWLLIKQCW